MGAASYVDPSFVEDTDVDGVVGIGFGYNNGIRPVKGLTFFETIMPQLPKHEFSVAMRHKCPGSYDFGFTDPRKMASPFVYANVTDEPYWANYRFYGGGFHIGSRPVTHRYMNMHLTTSSPVTYTDPDIVSDYWKMVPGAKYDNDLEVYTFPCNAKNLPDLTFIISGSDQVVPGKYMNVGPIDDGGKTCYGGLQNIGGGVDFSLLGNNFFKDKYIRHDMNDVKNIKVGFARQTPY